MTTEQQSDKCVFCTEVFSNKEDYLEHFRKHGDPLYKSHKNKSKLNTDSPNANDKSSEDSEMVGCDVCDEMFPTISKAITHKHKVHPDHDAKYFCPFCGKLFTMKHLYNKHIQTNHESQTCVEKSEFHCDCCEVMFYVPSAMLYHNKFFHRQDTEIPAIGFSKKVKLCSQEMIQIYYCAFCGEEYNNKVNLHKHVGEDHADENQSPTDVLKCPLCEALFYHLDAYELHLMFHSTEDLYSEKNEMVDGLTEFSLETVPPVFEKIEEEIAPDESVEIGNGMDFLQLLMGESGENEMTGRVKVKKHKKHKKSKKAAITLDEFLNMNKDVFGDGLDVQGIEEVPTQAVLKKVKSKRAINNKTKSINADINKLKKQGITVKTKAGNNLKTNVNKFILNKTNIDPTNSEDKQKNTITAPDELLSKLIRQGNSQIKIVKKSTNQNVKEYEPEAPTDDSLAVKDNIESNETSIPASNQDKVSNKSVINNEMKHDYDENKSNYQKRSVQGQIDSMDGNEMNTDNEHIEDEIYNNLNEKNCTHDFENNTNTTKSPHNPNDDYSDTDLNTSSENTHMDIEHNSSNASIGALKHLSHLITIKPVKQENVEQENVENEKTVTSQSDNINSIDNRDSDSPVASKKNVLPQKQNLTNKTSEALKNLSKHVIVKSISTNSPTSETNDSKKDKKSEHEIERNTSTKTIMLSSSQNKPASKSEARSELQNRLIGVSPKQAINKVNQKLDVQVAKPVVTNIKVEPIEQKSINEDIEIYNIDDSDSEEAYEQFEVMKPKIPESIKSEVNKKESVQLQNVLHNLGTNITIKSCLQKPAVSEDKNKPFNSESQPQVDNSKYKKVNKPSPEIQKSINLQNTLKNLGSNITIKSKNSSFCTHEEYTAFEDNEENSDRNNSDSETEVGKVKITEVTEEVSDHDNEYGDEADTNAIVQSPEPSHEDNEYHSFDEDSDIESQIKASTLNKSECQTQRPNNSDNIQCLNKELVIKSMNDNKFSNDNIPFERKNAMGSNSSKSLTQANACASQINTLNRKMNTSSNEVNTVKTVKKFQTETVIQEVTTVTRTIRTVNESTNEIVQSGSPSAITPQKIMKSQPGKEYHGKVVRHISPTVGTKIRQPGNIRPTNCANIRSPNQIVPIRTIANPIKTVQPGMQIVRKTPTNNQQKPVVNKLKMSPHLINQTTAKRTLESNSTVTSKKPRESAVSSPNSKNNSDEQVEQYTASTSKTEFSNVTKLVKGKCSTITTQMRSEVSASTQHQLSKLSNMSGLKIMKTSTKQEVVAEKSEVSASKRNTLEALEKLQKQGVLVKKPRVEFSESNEHDYFSESEEDGYEQ